MTLEEDFEWGDPPPGSVGRPTAAYWEEVAEKLKSRPRQWALVAKNVNRSTAYNITNGNIRAFKDGLWEATQRGGLRRGYALDHADVYVRYLGPWEER